MFNYPFDFHFTSAIVCRVANSLKDAALCQREIKEVMNIDKARRQHQDYIAILRYDLNVLKFNRKNFI
jgi:predicted XRE-type DNA-binding protein